MRVLIDRGICSHHPAGCEQCFGEFLSQGSLPDRLCIVEVQEDGKPEVTAVIRLGTYEGVLVVSDSNREEIIYHGWMKFVNMPPQAYERGLSQEECPRAEREAGQSPRN